MAKELTSITISHPNQTVWVPGWGTGSSSCTSIPVPQGPFLSRCDTPLLTATSRCFIVEGRVTSMSDSRREPEVVHSSLASDWCRRLGFHRLRHQLSRPSSRLDRFRRTSERWSRTCPPRPMRARSAEWRSASRPLRNDSIVLRVSTETPLPPLPAHGAVDAAHQGRVRRCTASRCRGRPAPVHQGHRRRTAGWRRDPADARDRAARQQLAHAERRRSPWSCSRAESVRHRSTWRSSRRWRGWRGAGACGAALVSVRGGAEGASLRPRGDFSSRSACGSQAVRRAADAGAVAPVAGFQAGDTAKVRLRVRSGADARSRMFEAREDDRGWTWLSRSDGGGCVARDLQRVSRLQARRSRSCAGRRCFPSRSSLCGGRGARGAGRGSERRVASDN